MSSSIGKVKSSFTNTNFILASLVLLLVLFIRVTRGLDLTDEMQYYGEIKGLIETGKLFSNDLFIQQSVYILLYPMFYIYHKLFDYEGFVFFGRLIMAVLTIAVFIYAYRKLLEFKFSAHVAGLTALSLTFAIPYHGIFAPSYNTISQVLWIIFVIRFFEWKQQRAISWAAIPVITAFAHPTSAVMMAVLILMRMSVERDFKQVAKVILALLGGGLIALPIVLYFASPEAYLDSLKFSSGYGVGSAFFSNIYKPIALLFIYAMFFLFLIFGRRFRGATFSLIGVCLTVVSIVLFLVGFAGGAYNTMVVCVLSSLSALAFGWAQSNISDSGDTKLMRNLYWLVAALLAYATTLGVTSGNGLGQATGAFMVGLPLLLGNALSTGAKNEGSGSFFIFRIASVALVLTLLFVQWSRYPYREAGWWQANQPIQSVPEFSLITSSQERTAFIQRMKHELEPMVQGKRTLIISKYPGLYFALRAHPETCMLYMHSLTSDKSEGVLLNCLSKKKPEIVIDVLADKDMVQEDLRINYMMHRYYSQRGINCTNETMKFNSISKNNPEQLRYSVCM